MTSRWLCVAAAAGLWQMGAAAGLGQMAAAPSGPLIWSDEFSGAAGSRPDPSKWTYDIGGGGWGNAELETYTDKAQNAFVDGAGHLVIRAIRDAEGRITSARLKTQGLFSFDYGRAEARMKIPRGQGMWAAFWMLGDNIQKDGWPACGEVDVMETLGREPATVHGTVHGPGYSGGNSLSAQTTLPGGPALADDFHVYAVEWTPQRIEFSIDGHVYSKTTPAELPPKGKWVYDHPFFLLVNLAVGGKWPGNPDASTVFPQELLIDYVRVYGP